MRFGTGPVFASECVAAARRWHLYLIRSALVAALLAGMSTIAATRHVSDGPNAVREYAALGEGYFYAMIGVEMAIVLLAAPAATAGAICLDRARGNLAHMLVTDLSAPEIVLGKLAARLLPVFGLVACSWPVMAIGTLLGGIDPTALTMAFAVILASAVFGCTLALALSVWARKTQEVLMATYTAIGLFLLAYPCWHGLSQSRAIPGPPSWLLHANPVYLAFVPYWAPGTTDWRDDAAFFAATLGASAVLTLLAVWRLRPASAREASRGDRSPRLGLLGRLVRAMPAPPLDANPVLWREWHRTRPSPWMILLTTLVIGTTTACCIAGAVAMMTHGVKPQPASFPKYAGVYGYIVHVIFGLLLFSAVAPTAMTEERQRGSLDVLMTTPLSTASIVMGKWWGTFRLVPLLAAGPTIMAVAMAYGPGDLGEPPFGRLFSPKSAYGVLVLVATLLVHGALLTSLGLALATWIRRPSRAMAISVSAYVLIAIAWPVAYFSLGLGARPPWTDPRPALSPIFVAGSLVDGLTMPGNDLTAFYVGATLWDLLALLAAVALLAGTLRTFDRCLGRMPESPEFAGWRHAVKPVIRKAELGEWEAG